MCDYGRSFARGNNFSTFLYKLHIWHCQITSQKSLISLEMVLIPSLISKLAQRWFLPISHTKVAHWRFPFTSLTPKISHWSHSHLSHQSSFIGAIHIFHTKVLSLEMVSSHLSYQLAVIGDLSYQLALTGDGLINNKHKTVFKAIHKYYNHWQDCLYIYNSIITKCKQVWK